METDPPPSDTVAVEEPVVEQPAKPKSRRGMKKPISDAQREHLARARERAAEALRTKGELNRLEKAAKKKTQAERLAELRSKVMPPPEDSEPQPGPVAPAEPEQKPVARRRRRQQAPQSSSDDSSDSSDEDTSTRRYREKYRARYAARYASRSMNMQPMMMMPAYAAPTWPTMPMMPQVASQPLAASEPPAPTKPAKQLHEIAKAEVRDRVNNEVLRMAFRSVFPGAESSPYDS